ncbi:MAG: efflux RND transporter periplasmic adaptor subunit [Candidatus Hydrogenedentes bacterium]|nr:efflux RND transporter periplasmic adaptor subunit [Candidatus Hydrogenedentota bacterium]
MKKRFAILILVVLVAGGGVAFWKLRGNGAEKPDAPQLRAVTAERGPISKEIECSGYIESNLDVEIKCKASGEITELPFDVSDPVEKGDLLLMLDPIDEERSVRQAEIQLASSEAKLAREKQSLHVAEQELANLRLEAEATLKAAEASAVELREKAHRTAALLKKEYASAEEVQSAEASAVQAEATLDKARVGIRCLDVEAERLELTRQDIKLAEAEVESDKIALENARQRLSETQVYAPMSGVISARMVQVGQIISSPTNNVSGGTELLTLSDLSRVFVVASVDEADIGEVEVGQAATITADAFSDDEFHGEVKRVATKGTNVSNVVTFEVKIEVLGDGKERLRPEMTADVAILAASNDNALLVPCEAVRGNGPRKMVLTPSADGGPPAPTPVEVGMSDGTHTEILSGVDEGATVLVEESQTDSQWIGGGPMGGPPPGMAGPPPGMMGGPGR